MGLDPERWSGFALAALGRALLPWSATGKKIDEHTRRLYISDLRFLEQF